MPPRSASNRGGPRRGGGLARGGASSPSPNPLSRGGRGGGAGRGSQPSAAPSTAVSTHVETVGVRRPNFGTAGRAIKVFVNSFAINSIPQNFIFQYDVIGSDKFSPSTNQKIFEALQNQETEIFTPKMVYDNRKIAFSSRELPFGDADARRFDVVLLDSERRSGSKSDRPPRPFSITLTKVAKINPELLDRYVQGVQSIDEKVAMAITALNVVIRMAPNQIYPHNKRSFYTPQEKKDIGNGIELWRGIFQSVRPAIGKLIVTIDLTTAPMYKEGPLIKLCLEFIGNPNLRAQHLSPNHGLRPYDRLKLQKFLSGLKIISRSTGNKPRTIRRLSDQGADTLQFNNSTGGTMTVANYFTSINMPLQYPSVICIQVGPVAMIPLEMCTVIRGQIVKSLPEDKVQDRLDFSTLKPDVRLDRIKRGIQNLQYGRSDYVRQFGMDIDTEPLQISARVINQPKLRYGGSGPQTMVEPRNGAWNMVGKKFYKPAAIGAWVILIYELEHKFTDTDSHEAVAAFSRACQSVGITFANKDPIIKRENPRGEIEDHIKKIGSVCREKYNQIPSLVVAILPETGGDIYAAVKHIGDIKLGCATQCLRASKSRRAKEQYWMNVLLKVNVKLGGVNVIPDPAAVVTLSDPANSTIVMGADVIHPGNTDKPSFTAVVGSVDSQCVKYVATSRVQTGRQEIIDDLQEMCKRILQLRIAYGTGVERKSREQAIPKRLIFYRDGVSEGQFKQVLDNELPLIQAACTELGINPKITLIVVGKRHHNQMFPTQPTRDRSGNSDAGTVIDSGITHPTEFDFILLSHAGILGTSRPAHYSVLFDQIGFNADTMQSLSFALCHIYARSTRSVSIPAPVYYADIVCSRAKLHFDPKGSLGLSETNTEATGAGAGGLDAYKAAYKPLHPNQEKLMYFT